MLADQSYRLKSLADARGGRDPVAVDPARVRSIALSTLASRGSLRPEAVKLVESPLMKEGRLCGASFLLLGPRSTVLTAIWDADRNELWCYDTRGVRFSTVPTG